MHTHKKLKKIQDGNYLRKKKQKDEKEHRNIRNVPFLKLGG